jgi:hypothetical protein
MPANSIFGLFVERTGWLLSADVLDIINHRYNDEIVLRGVDEKAGEGG